jgi:hypothetical protein
MFNRNRVDSSCAQNEFVAVEFSRFRRAATGRLPSSNMLNAAKGGVCALLDIVATGEVFPVGWVGQKSELSSAAILLSCCQKR